LPPPSQWGSLSQAEDEFRRVSFRAQYVRGKDALVWAGGSALREDVKTPGVFIFAPVRLSSGQVVVINRGFVPDARPTGTSPRPAAPAGPVTVVGILRWPEAQGWSLTTAYDRSANLWFVRDHLAIARENGWGPVAPFYLERETQQPTDGLPSPGPFKPNLPNNHLQYALTWFGLAAVLAGVFGFWAYGRWRELRTEEKA
jgi:cytochrome oxidase assembly protein ShyY1